MSFVQNPAYKCAQRKVHVIEMKIMKSQLFLYMTLLGAPLVGLLVGYLGAAWWFQGYTIKTPNLIGCKVIKSLRLASEYQLNISIIEEVVDQNVPPETVVNQYPRPGLKTRPHQTIFVTITKKPDILRAPDFLEKSWDDIVVVAKSMHLDVRQIFTPFLFTCNMCFAQVPEPGVEMIDRKMLVYVAQPTQSLFVVPSLIGLSIPAVKAVLSRVSMGLEFLGGDNFGDECSVRGHNPQPGSIINPVKQQHVQVYCSSSSRGIHNEVFS